MSRAKTSFRPPTIDNPDTRWNTQGIDQFFNALKSGNVDHVRNVVRQNNISYNVVDATYQTPIHVVLGMDEKTLNNTAKLNLIQFLFQMGAPLDLPNKQGIWPIHLAAQLQSSRIVNYLIAQSVDLNVSDTFGNTPLHYAVLGKLVQCTESFVSRPLIPAPLRNPLNEPLEDLTIIITDVLRNDANMNLELYKLLNSINRMHLEFIDEQLSNKIDEAVMTIFTRTNTSANQYANLESIMNNLILQISEKVKTVLLPLNIRIHRDNAWGPSFYDTASATYRESTDEEKIMSKRRDTLFDDRQIDEYEQSLQTFKNAPFIRTAQKTLATLQTDAQQLIMNTVFCDQCTNKYEYGLFATLLKSMVFIMLGNLKSTFHTIMTDSIVESNRPFTDMNTNVLFKGVGRPLYEVLTTMNLNERESIVTLGAGVPLTFPKTWNEAFRFDFPAYFTDYVSILRNVIRADDYDDHYLLRKLQSNLINSYVTNLNPHHVNDLLNQKMGTYAFATDGAIRGLTLKTVITNELYRLQTMMKNANANHFLPFSFYQSEHAYVNYNPATGAQEYYVIDDKSKILFPRTPLPVAAQVYTFEGKVNLGALRGAPQPGSLQGNVRVPHYCGFSDNYTFFELFQIMHKIIYFMNNAYQDFSEDNFFDQIPTIFDVPMNQWTNHHTTFENLPSHAGNSIVQNFPNFILCYRVLAFEMEKHFTSILKKAIQRVENKFLAQPLASLAPNEQVYYYLFTGVDKNTFLKILFPWTSTTLLQGKKVDQTWLNQTYQLLESIDANAFVALNDFVLTRLSYAVNMDLAAGNANILNNPMFFPTFLREPFFDTLYPAGSPYLAAVFANTELINMIYGYIDGKIKPEVKNMFDQAEPLYNVFNNALASYNNVSQRMSAEFIEQQHVGPAVFHRDIGFANYVVAYLIYFQQNYFVTLKYWLNVLSEMINRFTEAPYYLRMQLYYPLVVNATLTCLFYLQNFVNNLNTFEKNVKEYVPSYRALSLLILNWITKTREQIGNIWQSFNEPLMNIYSTMIDIFNAQRDIELLKTIETASINANYDANNIFSREINEIMEALPIFDDAIYNETFDNLMQTFLNAFTLNNILLFHNSDSTIINAHLEQLALTGFFVTYAIDSRHDVNGVNTWQLRLTADYKISRASSQAGNWLELNANYISHQTWRMQFAQAFVGYRLKALPLNFGQLPFVAIDAQYLAGLKMRIVEMVIQFFAFYVTQDPTLNTGVLTDTNALDDIITKLMPTQGLLTEIDRQALMMSVIVGNLADAIINDLIKYTIRAKAYKVIMSYVLAHAPERNAYYQQHGITHFRTLQRQLTEALQPHVSNKQLVEDYVAHHHSPLTHLTLTHTQPFQFEYITHRIERDIHSVSPSNYFDTNTSNMRRSCYLVKAEIVRALITSHTLYAQNNDGNTAFQLALQNNNVQVLSLFREWDVQHDDMINNHDQNATQWIQKAWTDHMQYIQGSTLEQRLNHWIKPFNDALLGQLMIEKYNRHVLSKVTLAVPMICCLYQQLFHYYATTFAHGFTWSQYQALQLQPLYWDVYNLKNINRVMRTNTDARIAHDIITHTNVDAQQQKIRQLTQQLNEINKALALQSTPQLIAHQNNIASELQNLKNERDQMRQTVIVPDNLNTIIQQYQTNLKNLQSVLTDYQNPADFHQACLTPLHIPDYNVSAFWQDYLTKSSFETPSMFFFKCFDASVDHTMKLNILHQAIQIMQTSAQTEKYLQVNSHLQYMVKLWIYVINTTITPQATALIYATHLGYYTSLNDLLEFVNDIAAVQRAVEAAQFDGTKLNEFMNDVLPLKLIKHYLLIYDNEQDPDRKVAQVSEIFKPILLIVKNVTTAILESNNDIQKQLTNIIFPFLIHHYQYVIQMMQNVLRGFDKYVMQSHTLLSSLQAMK